MNDRRKSFPRLSGWLKEGAGVVHDMLLHEQLLCDKNNARFFFFFCGDIVLRSRNFVASIEEGGMCRQ